MVVVTVFTTNRKQQRTAKGHWLLPSVTVGVLSDVLAPAPREARYPIYFHITRLATLSRESVWLLSRCHLTCA
jgi:hypothetical protein